MQRAIIFCNTAGILNTSAYQTISLSDRPSPVRLILNVLVDTVVRHCTAKFLCCNTYTVEYIGTYTCLHFIFYSYIHSVGKIKERARL
jgi:hypothetical protein